MSNETVVVPAISVNARRAALGWLNAFLATSHEEARPLLYRTIALEWFGGGVQMVSTNGHVLFRSWVPCDEGDEWPLIEEAPDQSIIVMDPDGFGLSFMRTLLALTGDEAHQYDQLALSVMPMDDEAEPALGEAFQTDRLVLRAAGQRLDLRLMQDAYPNWRALKIGIDKAERVDGLTLAPRLLGLIGKLKEVTSIDLDFHGDDKYVAFSAPTVRGLVMPMRRADRPGGDE